MIEKALFCLLESPLHCGCGQAMDTVDLPVIRERATGYPYVPGSTVKGIFRDHYERNGGATASKLVDVCFGTSPAGDDSGGNAGAAIFSDLQLLFFPVRCAEKAWVWVTCPNVLRRFSRFSARAGLDLISDDFELSDEKIRICDEKLGSVLHIEEFTLSVDSVKTKKLSDWAGSLDNELEEVMVGFPGVSEKLCLVSDRFFYYLVTQATEVVARIAIDEKTGTVKQGALFYEELVPQDALFYGGISFESNHNYNAKEVGESAVSHSEYFFSKLPKYLQMGGDSSLGRGFFQIAPLTAKSSGNKGGAK